MQEPGFWDDQERAARVSAEHARAQRKLAGYQQLEQDVDDLEALEEMATEDESIAGELEGQRAQVEARLAELAGGGPPSGPRAPRDAAGSGPAGAGRGRLRG